MNYIDELTISKGMVTINNLLPKIGLDDARNEMINGLLANKKYISSKFFYDETGSKLFEDITQLEEYYPTRVEMSIIKSVANKVAVDFENTTIIELGSGDCSKMSIFLGAISKDYLKSLSYVSVDVSQSAIEESANCLSAKFPMLKIDGIVADFLHQLHLIPKGESRLFCFFGSTIGNLSREEAYEFISNVSENMQTGDKLLLGMDMVKDISILENAYNDSKKVTAAFNKNILKVVNTLSKTDFNIDYFDHVAFYNKEKFRIEMHLKAKKDMEVSSPYLETKIKLRKGETIHTENSHKFTKSHISKLGAMAGLKIRDIFSDTNQWFSLVQFEK